MFTLVNTVFTASQTSFQPYKHETESKKLFQGARLRDDHRSSKVSIFSTSVKRLLQVPPWFLPPLKWFSTSGCYQLILITEIESTTTVKNELREMFKLLSL